MSFHKLKAAYAMVIGAAKKFHLNILGVLQGQDVHVPSQSIPEKFDKQFEQNGFPERKAIISGSRIVTYGELKTVSEKLAGILLERFLVGNGILDTPVVFGLHTSANEHRIISMMAVLKVKCAFLSLDANLPPERVTYMLREAKVKFILHDFSSQLLAEVLQNDPDLELVDVKDLLRTEGVMEITYEKCPWISDTDPLVSFFFTSGSTSHPKGVPIYTSNLMNRLSWQWDCLPFAGDDIACHKTSVLFIDSLNEIFGALLQGIPLVILTKDTISKPESFVSAIEMNQISRLILVPSLLKMLVDYLNSTKFLNKVFSIRSIISSGENLTPDIARKVFSVFPLRTVLYNLYGSTETVGDITWQCFDSVDDVDAWTYEGSVSIGKPVHNSCAVILDENGKTCGEGKVGDIYVTGFNILKSYLNESPNKSGAFQDNFLFSKKGHEILFKMGDCGVVKNGRLYFQGRSDCMVKVRGHRVNLREIEIFINNLEGVKCLVLPYTDVNGYIIPVAFCKTGEGNEITMQDLNEKSRRHFPSYSLPRFFCMEQFPIQAHTGKVDRQAMIQIFRNAVLNSNPRKRNPNITERQSKILYVLAKNLSVPVGDINGARSFFENGGNSLSAVVAVSDLNTEGIEIDLNHFLQVSSVDDLLESEIPYVENIAGVKLLAERYEVAFLNTVPKKERAIKVLAEGFTQKNPLDVLAGTSEQQFTRIMQDIWQDVISENLSNIVIDKTSGDIVGASIVLDLINPLAAFEVYEPREVLEVNLAVEDPVKKKLLQSGGRWANALLNAVDVRIPDDIALALVEKMDDFIVETARTRGFDGIFAINSHPVTMALAEPQGYVTMNTLHVKSFCYQGRYPFKDAEDTYFIKAMVKNLT